MASTFITRTSGTSTNVDKCTFSAWIKRGNLSSSDHILMGQYTDANNRGKILISDNQLAYFEKTSGSTTANAKATRQFRDTSAWYHIVLAFDSTQSTAADRIKFYVNGVQETVFSNTDYVPQDGNIRLNESSVPIFIGQDGNSAHYFDGQMAHVHFVDGTAYDASTFGETDSTSGIWKPKASPTGITYGTNGFFLKFENSGNLDLDSSGNNLTFTTSGTLTQNEDTPSNNFPTFNVLNPGNDQLTIQNGSLFVFNNSNNNWASTPATMGLESGKWYWELKDEEDWGSTSDSSRRYGICDLNTIVSTLGTAADVRYSGSTSAYAYMNASGVRYNGGTISGTTSTHPTFQKDDFIMVAMDLDNNKLYFGKNGTWNDSGDPTSGSTGTGSVADISSTAVWAPYVETHYGSDNVSINFGQGYFKTTSAGSNTDANGQGKFKYTVPSGYYAICTKNIKEFG